MTLRDQWLGAHKGALSAVDSFSARKTAGQIAGAGHWGLKTYNAQRFDTGDALDAASLDRHAEIVLHIAHFPQNQGSWIAFLLEDMPGWKPFVVVRGNPANTLIHAGVTFSQDRPEDEPGFNEPMNWDATQDWHEIIGPTSDGSLAAGNRPAIIQMSCGDGSQMRIIEGLLGWTKLASS